jgi:hypothetical protein
MRRPSTIEGSTDDREVTMATVETAVEIRPFHAGDSGSEVGKTFDAASTRRAGPARSSSEVDRGGPFAAWEEPELFTSEIRAAFRSLRKRQASTSREHGGSR